MFKKQIFDMPKVGGGTLTVVAAASPKDAFTPAGNPAGITSLDDLAGDGLKLMIAGQDVPVGS